MKIAAVIVTRDRLSYLKKCVGALREQTRKPDGIIVIDNDSGDGTKDWLKEQDDLTVFRQGNLGSSGGQWRGVKEAYEAGYDWFWCMDDDTVPDATALSEMMAVKEFSDEKTGFLCSHVRWSDGNPHKMNIPVIQVLPKHYPMLSDLQDRERGVLPVLSCSFVSLMVSRAAVKEAGLPLKDLFIWLDDVEFTERISKHLRGYQVLRSRVLHDTLSNAGADLDELKPANVFKFKYFLRNGTFLERRRRVSTLERYVYCLKMIKWVFCSVPGRVDGASTRELLRYFLWGLVYSPKIDKMK